MITDPDEPGYRYPEPGERLWHQPWQEWIRITDNQPYGHRIIDEVAGVRESDGQQVVVKLRSLEPEETPRSALSPLLGLPYTVDPDRPGYRVQIPKEGGSR